ncbi:MAG: alpha/beta fold hydrolase, partial [Thermoguttaceae bacterium]|nr:alpha/beta fold hydrolase [Thermoguttaceae bacterium]
MKRNALILSLSTWLVLAFWTSFVGADEGNANYRYLEYPLERAGIALHLDRVFVEGTEPEKEILLIHGLTYSSHEFDVDYRDYSLVRKLAREGYGVWRLDIAGYGRSGEVDDGFLPDADYAAEDIRAAVEKIVEQTGREQIDILGWSWGTITVGRYLATRPNRIRKAVLYAPVLHGFGEYDVTEPFHHNTWEHAVEDFQRAPDGTIDETIADPIVVAILGSNSWRYDG